MYTLSTWLTVLEYVMVLLLSAVMRGEDDQTFKGPKVKDKAFFLRV